MEPRKPASEIVVHPLDEFKPLPDLDSTWMEFAVCRGQDYSSFFFGLDPEYEELLAKARAICDPCPVKKECLEHALALPAEHGIFAGTTPAQRKTLKAQLSE